MELLFWCLLYGFEKTRNSTNINSFSILYEDHVTLEVKAILDTILLCEPLQRVRDSHHKLYDSPSPYVEIYINRIFQSLKLPREMFLVWIATGLLRYEYMNWIKKLYKLRNVENSRLSVLQQAFRADELVQIREILNQGITTFLFKRLCEVVFRIVLRIRLLILTELDSDEIIVLTQTANELTPTQIHTNKLII